MDHQSHHSKVKPQMTFFWDKDSIILFSDWPGTRTGMYVAALVFVFVLSFVLEWLSHCRRIDREGWGNVSGSVIQSLVHGVRTGLDYLVMLALMSFNVGVVLVALAGYTFAYLLFASGVFAKPGEWKKDYPPASLGCC